MANKHTISDLYQMQSLPLEAKIRMAENRIRIWYEEFDGNVYVARSGGKDSDVLGDIVKRMYPNVPQIFVNTGLELDSVRIHGTAVADEVLRPEMNFVEVITKYGYPIISKSVAHSVGIARNNPDGKVMKNMFMNAQKGSRYDYSKYSYLLNAPFRISDSCCQYSKKNPSRDYAKRTNRKPFLGTMANESFLRKTAWLKNGCNSFDSKNPSSQPLSFWTEQDILQYIVQEIKPEFDYYWKLAQYSKGSARRKAQKWVKQHGYSRHGIASAYGDIVYKDDDGMFYDNDVFNSVMKLTTTGESRTGCVFCMFGITKDTDRFLRLKEIEPKKYDYVMRGGKFDEKGLWIPHNGLGYKFVIDWLNENGDMNIKY